MFSDLAVPTDPRAALPPGINPAKVSSFLALHRKFTNGTAWINREYAKRGWTDTYRTMDPEFEKDIKEFETQVVEPMDRAWTELNDEERTAALPQKL